MSAELVRQLLLDQQPDLANLPIQFGAQGWDNQLWRLGDELAVRLPWQSETADALLVKEHTWVPALASLLTLPIPIPQRIGHPSALYPHPWMVTTWVPGNPADIAPVIDHEQSPGILATFLTELHRPAPAGAPTGRGRGASLSSVASGIEGRFEEMAKLCTEVARSNGISTPDLGRVRAVWNDAVSQPEWNGPNVWLHGDLHPANVLTARGKVCGIIDFGDLCAGDPALDLAASWILLPSVTAIDRFQATYGSTTGSAVWRRARGWAVWRAFGSITVATTTPPGAKPSWGPPAIESLRRLTSVIS